MFLRKGVLKICSKFTGEFSPVNLLHNVRTLLIRTSLLTASDTLNVKLWNSQLNKVKSEMTNETEVVLRLSWNMIDNFDETNFSHKLLLTDRQDENLR